MTTMMIWIHLMMRWKYNERENRGRIPKWIFKCEQYFLFICITQQFQFQFQIARLIKMRLLLCFPFARIADFVTKKTDILRININKKKLSANLGNWWFIALLGATNGFFDDSIMGKLWFCFVSNLFTSISIGRWSAIISKLLQIR